jgi:ribosomal protein S18 acetylase RimI-like enzyme
MPISASCSRALGNRKSESLGRAFALVKSTGKKFASEWVIVGRLRAVRPAQQQDHDAIWRILEPVIRAGETYPLPRDMTQAEVIAYWIRPDHETFVGEEDGQLVGTYYLRANQPGGGAHVANCGYIITCDATGRGVGRQMCEHSLEYARSRGFRAMQFNFVVSTNKRAIGLWQRLGFETIGRLPLAFNHPRHGYVDALIMFRTL